MYLDVVYICKAICTQSCVMLKRIGQWILGCIFSKLGRVLIKKLFLLAGPSQDVFLLPHILQ